jgi:hypothetical protein
VKISADDTDGGEKKTKEKRGKRKGAAAAAAAASVNLSSVQSGFDLPIPSLIRIALGHSDEELRTDALDLLCVGKKTIESPTYFELDMMKYFLWVNIKASSQALRQAAIPKIGKFLQRLKVHSILSALSPFPPVRFGLRLTCVGGPPPAGLRLC